MSKSPLRDRPLPRDLCVDDAFGSMQTDAGFSCKDCGSPAILLPSDLSAQALVLCDHCRAPVATLAAFRAHVDRLTAGAQVCDHHLTNCHGGGAKPSSSTAIRSLS